MQQLFEKEKEIMDIIWGKEQPCLISDILKQDASLSRNTVAKALVTLEKKGFLRVDGVRKTVTRSGRTYVAAITKLEYEIQMKLLSSLEQSTSLPDFTDQLIDIIREHGEFGSMVLGRMQEKIKG